VNLKDAEQFTSVPSSKSKVSSHGTHELDSLAAHRELCNGAMWMREVDFLASLN
jgi:hypothetical protein